MTIRLAEATINNNDIDSLRDWLGTYPRLTKGELTLEFEEKFSKYLGVKHSIFVNSGSSANLLMLAALRESEFHNFPRGSKVVVPAVSWATDLAPVMQLGYHPILCDCNMWDYSVDLFKLEKIFKEERPRALLLVSVLGLVPEMSEVVNLCDEYGVILLEDTCESMGSEHLGQKLGTFGLMSSFSTYFGHHISTIEGGIVCTNSDYYAKLLRSLRSHGWARDWTNRQQEEARKKHGISDFDSLYSFYYPGFNVRSTDLNAFIGIGQLEKLPDIVKIRNRNFNIYHYAFKEVHQSPFDYISNFAYPLVTENRKEIVKALQKADIEVRPLIAGSMGRQPMYTKQYGVKPLRNADRVMANGLYLPNHHLLTKSDVETVIEVVRSCL